MNRDAYRSHSRFTQKDFIRAVEHGLQPNLLVRTLGYSIFSLMALIGDPIYINVVQEVLGTNPVYSGLV